MAKKPLEGVRVIELGQLLAGPFAGCILAYFGAEVIKVEPPGSGDPIRNWRVVENGTSLWWRSIARNKKSVTLNLREQAGRDIVKQLLKNADVLIENFRPGTMEKWGLSPEAVKEINSQLVYARISGYGQTGPYSHKPGFASVGEAFSGFRYVTGFPDGPSVRPNLSIGDTVSGIHAALGIVMALYAKKVGNADGGQVVDVALYESMFNLLEAIVPEFSGAGVVREPSGTTITGIVPTNIYRCADAKYVVIGGNGDSIFQRLMTAAQRSDMANDARMANNAGRVQHQEEIDAALAEWCGSLPSKQVIDILEQERVPVGPIYNAEDMLADPHYNARGLFEGVEIDGKPLKVPAIMPKLTETPGATEWPGGELGSHNSEVLGDLLGLSEEEQSTLRAQNIID